MKNTTRYLAAAALLPRQQMDDFWFCLGAHGLVSYRRSSSAYRAGRPITASLEREDGMVSRLRVARNQTYYGPDSTEHNRALNGAEVGLELYDMMASFRRNDFPVLQQRREVDGVTVLNVAEEGRVFVDVVSNKRRISLDYIFLC